MNNDKLQSLYNEVPHLKQFSETVLRSLGSSVCFLVAIYKAVMTGQGCRVFEGIDWNACARSGKLKQISKRLVSVNEQYRKANINLISEVKDVLADFITEKTCFDEDDARTFAESLEERFSTTSQVCDGLLDLTMMLDQVTGKTESRYRRQLSNLQNRIVELESNYGLQEQNDQLSDQKGIVICQETIMESTQIGGLLGGAKLKIDLNREWSSQACE